MNLLMVGSASQYAKNAARKTQWDLKKRSGDLTGHKKSLSDYVNITKASSVLPQTDTDSKMSAIMTKAQAGKKLSYDEWEYLRAKNPVMYEKLREVEKEQKAYEEELKHCKTKDEARRLHLSKLGDVLTAAKNGDESALFRLNRLTRTMTEFAKSDKYRELPTEAEETIERESEREAREDALRIEAEIKEREAERRKESQSETEKDSVPDTEKEPLSDAESEPVRETLSEPEPVAETKSGFKPKAALSGEVTPFPERQNVPTPEPYHAVSVLSFGQREYANQRDGASRTDSRRRTFDA
ncbi:MAG: hypothetical protein IKR84_02995 [Oscillibacter sp.]|nr:hypothetical protein [Oscillibacter sp.]